MDNLLVVPAHPILYTTAACSACEAALDLLAALPAAPHRALVAQEVALDDALLRRYGERVPVLAFGGRELDWPFDAGDVMRLFATA